MIRYYKHVKTKNTDILGDHTNCSYDYIYLYIHIHTWQPAPPVVAHAALCLHVHGGFRIGGMDSGPKID